MKKSIFTIALLAVFLLCSCKESKSILIGKVTPLQPVLQQSCESTDEQPVTEETHEPEQKEETAPEQPPKEIIEQSQPIAEKKEPDTEIILPQIENVNITIRGSENVGTILAQTEVAWEEGMTVFSLLQKITREHGILMEFSGGETNAYVEGIANLYEFDEGPLSGWIYRVNGEILQKGASSAKLSPGDTVEWLYSINMGKDLD